jgi:predicted ATPase
MRDLPAGTVTFLFTDVEGSTRLLLNSEEAYPAALAEHRRLLREAFGHHGGVEVDTQGDAFFYAFGRASDAVAAAEAGQAALKAGPIRIRMGLHTGEPTLTEEGYVGIDVHKGARIAAAGHGGQILLSQATRDLVDSDVRDLGSHRLKDLLAAERVFQLGTSEFPPLKTLYRTNLPIPSTPFLGREHELSEVTELLARDDTRLATLTGAGGIGKTRLALQSAAAVAEDYPDGVWWVPLAPLRDPQLVLRQAEQVLGSKDGLIDHIGDKRLLFLFDNFEHLLDAGYALAELLNACPNVKLLVTSREPLHLSREREYAVPSFTQEEAMALFCDRGTTAEPEETVRSICLRLDCLPLAIELAAARTKALSPQQILVRLEQRLPLLTGGPRDAPQRQKTLRATIEWSYELLSAVEQSLFVRLAAFAGGCTLEAAEAICDADLDLLQSLVDKSLVRHTGARFWMLETIREYAEERLDELPDAEDIRARHAHFFNRLASAAGATLTGPESSDVVELLDQEHPNIRVALRCALGSDKRDEALAACAGIWRYWERRGHTDEGIRWFDEAGDATVLPAAVRLEALRGAAALARQAGNVPRAEALAEEMLSFARSVGDVRMSGIAIAILGSIAVFMRDFDEAMSRLEYAHTTLREVGDDFALGHVLNTLAYTALARRDFAAAERHARDSFAVADRIGDAPGRALALTNLGVGHLLAGKYAEAEAAFVELLTYSHDIGFTDCVAYAYEGLAALATRRRDGVRAARLLGAAETLWETSGTQLDFVEQEVHDDVVGQLSSLVNRGELVAEWAAGREMATDEAIAYGLST